MACEGTATRASAAIVDGLRESVDEFQKSIPGASPQDVMQLVLMTQYPAFRGLAFCLGPKEISPPDARRFFFASFFDRLRLSRSLSTGSADQLGRSCIGSTSSIRRIDGDDLERSR
jgi:hypothetical protein